MLSDEEYLKLIQNYDYDFKKGDVVKGIICGFEGEDILVDINAKTSAICPCSEVILTNGQKTKDLFKVGDCIEFVVNSSEDDSVFYLSHKKIALYNSYKILEEKFKNDEVVTGIITNVVKGGVLVNVMGVKGFIPSSQLRECDEKEGAELELKILALDIEQNNFILSSKKLYNQELEKAKKEILDKIELNMVVKGIVARITDFGAFVDIGGLDGLLPLSQMSWSWIDSPSDILKVDDKIDVEIIAIDKEKQRVSLSLKTLEENPWLKAKELLKQDDIIKGRVTRIKHFGAFVEVYPKVEGLLSKIQLKEYQNRFNKELQENDELDVVIKKLDYENEKINLVLA